MKNRYTVLYNIHPFGGVLMASISNIHAIGLHPVLMYECVFCAYAIMHLFDDKCVGMMRLHTHPKVQKIKITQTSSIFKYRDNEFEV